MTITISGDTPSKKNSRKLVPRGNRIMSFPNDRYQAWHKAAMSELMQYTGQADNKVMVDYMFYVGTNRKKDLDNMIASVNDLLVDKGLLADDSWQNLCIGSADACIDRDNPRAEVTIIELE